MTIKINCFVSFLLLMSSIALAQQPATPDKLYGQLFTDVQLQKIFPDGKTFVDCTPKRPVKDILARYAALKGKNIDLQKFVSDHFELPPTPPQLNYIQQEKDVAMHIKNLWSTLKRDADPAAKTGSSILPLPYAYVVPGGRFREVYYWDSYFTMLGLKESGETKLIENMVKNFAFLINKYGHIPNGNRSYYLSRSQPPFFSMMVELLAGIRGNKIYSTYLPAMEKEYQYWMNGAVGLKAGNSSKAVTKLADGTILNRYWDAGITPRQESYKEDYELAEASAQELAMRIRVASPAQLKKILANHKTAIYKNLRAGAASGWDFSSRWFSNPESIASIETTSIIPVDLNCLLYQLEVNISKAAGIAGNKTKAASYRSKANTRKTAILKYCWNETAGFFVDYNAAAGAQQELITAAGLYPLFVKIASGKQAETIAATAREKLLKAGGIVTTTNTTGQQWDAPNGWAPLQWVAVTGLSNYNQDELAKDIATKWLGLNEKVYAATGKLMEKYNVEDISKEGGGGEYPAQDGFGWTNGVYLALKKIYPSIPN